MTCTGQGVSVHIHAALATRAGTCADALASTASTATRSSARGTVPASRFVAKRPAAPVVSDVMEQFFKGLQAELLQKIVAQSLDQLELEFFSESSKSHASSKSQASSSTSRPDEPKPGIREIADLRKLMQGPLNTQLTVFLFLFNVHVDLKDRVLEMDPSNRAKLVRFMSDMRKHVVLGFCVDERKLPHDFVREAYECYMLS